MSEILELSGQCMCGAVKVSAAANRTSAVACHCIMCQRWSAGPFISLNCDNVKFSSDDHVRRVQSSKWAERGFCNQCGSNLFYKIHNSDSYQIAVGLLDEKSALRLSLQVFTDQKPDFYDFANQTKMLTREQVLSQLAPKPE